MRSHADIVTAAGPDRVAELRRVSIHTVRSWVQRDRIPTEHWPAIVDAKLATTAELMAGHRPRKRTTPEQAAAA